MKERKSIHFTKMHGAGNNYIYIDDLGSPESVKIKELNLPDLSKKISNKNFGIGSDGLIVITPSSNADFFMRIFNADGSEAQMCGNGLRCVAKYVYDNGFIDKQSFTVETVGGIKKVDLFLKNNEVDEVKVNMGKALLLRKEIPAFGPSDEKMIDQSIEIGNQEFLVTGVGMGNPHGVIFVEKITDRHILEFGPLLENSSIWPEKANIEFIEIIDRSHIKMRVWERGSGETLACGTGACASVVAAYMKNLTDNKVEVILPGGSLNIFYDTASGEVYMTGKAEFIAEGEFFI